MSLYFSNTLKKLRTKKGLSQQALADKMYVTRSTIARWENGIRLPDAAMISRLSGVLGVDVNMLLSAAAQSDECPNVIMVDDRQADSHRQFTCIGGGHASCGCYGLYQSVRSY